VAAAAVVAGRWSPGDRWSSAPVAALVVAIVVGDSRGRRRRPRSLAPARFERPQIGLCAIKIARECRAHQAGMADTTFAMVLGDAWSTFDGIASTSCRKFGIAVVSERASERIAGRCGRQLLWSAPLGPVGGGYCGPRLRGGRAGRWSVAGRWDSIAQPPIGAQTEQTMGN
jgi:hypothetical protein